MAAPAKGKAVWPAYSQSISINYHFANLSSDTDVIELNLEPWLALVTLDSLP